MDIPKFVPHGEDENRCHKKSHRPKIFCLMTLPWSKHTFDGEEKMVEALTIFLFEGGRQLYWKVMKTLTSKGTFIGFLIGFKWLEPIKGLGHLI